MRSHPLYGTATQRFDQLPEVVMEQDICTFVLRVDDRMAQSVLDDRVIASVVPAEQEQPMIASNTSLAGEGGGHTLEGQAGGKPRISSTSSAPPFGTAARPSATKMPKGTVGEMLLVGDYIAR